MDLSCYPSGRLFRAVPGRVQRAGIEAQARPGYRARAARSPIITGPGPCLGWAKLGRASMGIGPNGQLYSDGACPPPPSTGAANPSGVFNSSLSSKASTGLGMLPNHRVHVQPWVKYKILIPSRCLFLPSRCRCFACSCTAIYLHGNTIRCCKS